MKNKTSTVPIVLCLLVLVSGFGMTGCSSSSAGDSTLIPGGASALSGQWEYLVTNAYAATFTNCTGDATILNGANFSEASALAPMCTLAVKFNVTQIDDSLQVAPHGVTCSDGSPASAGGAGQVESTDVYGAWDIASSGVQATQSFAGSVSQNTIAMVETARTFTGEFQGSCDLSPPLKALVTVIQ